MIHMYFIQILKTGGIQMKEVKLKSLKVLLTSTILYLLAGCILFPIGVSELIEGFDPVDLDEIDFSKDIRGLYVTGTIYGIYGDYCDTTKDNDLVERHYLIDTHDGHFIGLSIPEDKIDAAESLMNVSFDYLDGKLDDKELSKAQFKVKGTIKKMSQEILDLYKESLEWDTLTSEEQSYFLPYYISTKDIIGLTSIYTWFFLCSGAGCLILVVFRFIKFITGGYQKTLTTYISTSRNPDVTREKIESFLSHTNEIYGIKFNDTYIYAQQQATTVFGELKDIIWLYYSSTTHKVNYIKTGTTHRLAIGFLNGKRYEIKAKNEQTVQELIEHLSKVCPQSIIGYTDELDNIFRNNITAFCQIQYDKVMAEQQDHLSEDSTVPNTSNSTFR